MQGDREAHLVFHPGYVSFCLLLRAVHGGAEVWRDSDRWIPPWCLSAWWQSPLGSSAWSYPRNTPCLYPRFPRCVLTPSFVKVLYDLNR